jgi:carboxypeptidase C (cathepsin A)
MTTIRLAQILALCFCSLAFTAAADETQSSASDPGKGDDAKTEQEEILVTTEHSTTINGARIDYQATAGKLVMKSADLKSRADVFFVAYTRETDDPRKRPITFCFNGGPGSSSV